MNRISGGPSVAIGRALGGGMAMEQEQEYTRGDEGVLHRRYRQEKPERLINPKKAYADTEPARGTDASLANGSCDHHRTTRVTSSYGECDRTAVNSWTYNGQEDGFPKSFDSPAAHLNKRFAKLTAEVEQMRTELREAEAHSERLRTRLLDTVG